MGKIIKSTGSDYVPDKVNQYMSFIFICSQNSSHSCDGFSSVIR